MTRFDGRLADLKRSLGEMAARIESLTEHATALVDRAEGGEPARRTVEELAGAIVEADREIDEAEVEIEEEAIELLALQRPQAGELRLLVTILKINNDLERIGDHAVNIARAAAHISRLSTRVPIPPELDEMSRIARGMLSDALVAFRHESAEEASAVRERDDRVDQLQDSLFRVMLTQMPEHNVSGCLQVILIGRNLERIADLATNIGEDVVYLAHGTTVRHAGRRRVFGDGDV